MVEPTPITIQGNPIKLSNHTRFLGIHLDEKLNFNEHIDKITKRATISLLQCRRAVGPNWSLTPKTCSWIYERAIRPILTYASTIWINATTKQRNQKLLSKVERIALKMTTGCMPSTPTIALNQITNIATIIQFIEGEAAKGHLRLQATKQLTSERRTKTKGTIISHTYQNYNYINTLKLPQGENDMMRKRLNLNLKFKTIISNRDQIAEYLKSMKDEDITCYTDGSKIGTQTGYGYRISKNNNTITINEESGRMSSHCTVYQAELRVVTEAAKHLKDVNIINKNIHFLTDSISAIQAINIHIINSKTVDSTINSFNELAMNYNEIYISWVARHSGYDGNERADELAKIGTELTYIQKGYIPQSYCKSIVSKSVLNKSETKCWQQTSQHLRRTIKNNMNHIITTKHLKNNRKELRIATQLITGHIGLNYHLHKISRYETAMCESCKLEEETVEHFIGRCPAYHMTRQKYLYTFSDTLEDIFANNSLYKILQYALHTGRLTVHT